MRLLIPTLLIVSTLTGCASGGPQPVEMPARLPPPHLISTTEFPATLPEPEDASGPALLDSYVAAAKFYHLLRARYLSLVEWSLNPGR